MVEAHWLKSEPQQGLLCFGFNALERIDSPIQCSDIGVTNGDMIVADGEPCGRSQQHEPRFRSEEMEQAQ